MTSVQLSMGIPSFSAEAPPSWEHLTDWAQLLEGCGFDRVLVSEHIAFGTHMDAYANPATGEPPVAASPPARTATGWSR